MTQQAVTVLVSEHLAPGEREASGVGRRQDEALVTGDLLVEEISIARVRLGPPVAAG